MRHDSPNDKRYAALTVTFGVDLRPFLVRASEIAHASQAAEDAAERLRRIREADQVVPWLGISPNGWRSAQSGMGPAAAAVTLSASLKRQPPNQIAGGYLRSLTEKARVEKFTPVPMIKALLNRDVQDAR